MAHKKYTKNLHMHHLDDGGTTLDREAGDLIQGRIGSKTQKPPKRVGQWLQVTHREVFNRDFDLFVKAYSLTKHCMPS